MAGARLDVAVAELTELSRSKCAALVDDAQVRVRGKTEPRSYRVAAGDRIEVNVPEPRSEVALPTPVDMTVVYQDPDIVVVDKPAGVAAHPSVGWEGPDVLGALAAMQVPLTDLGPAERQGIVHRLDVGTSGLMVLARSDRAYTHLKAAFKNREVTKVYHALVQGHPDPLRGTIDAPIARDDRHSWKMGVMAGGRASITHYDTIETLMGATLLEINLETGRTHQIRVHMSAVGHPCLGDPLYGSDPILATATGLDRQWLHATALSFVHPDGSRVSYTSDYPADLAGALEVMREGSAW